MGLLVRFGAPALGRGIAADSPCSPTSTGEAVPALPLREAFYRRLLERIEHDPTAVLDRRLSLPTRQKVVATRHRWGRRNSRIVVVGGGLAGLSRRALVDEGADVTLLERKARLGGATWSFRRHGLSFDNGQHVFLRCCTAWGLERIGATDSVVLQDRLELPVVAPGGAVAWLRRNGLPAPLHLAGSLARYRHLSITDRVRLGRALLPLRCAALDDPALDETTFGAFLRAHGQHTPAIERVWDLICTPTVNLPADAASLTLAATVFKIGLLTDAAASDIGWAKVPLANVHAEPARQRSWNERAPTCERTLR